MHLKKSVCASLLLAIAATTAVTAAPSTRPAHDRDPWIFRCVLDQNARMCVLSLGNDVWAAYDTNRCTLAKLWIGDVEFTGPVFDTRHGPQPKSRGTHLLDRPTPLDPTPPTAATRPEPPTSGPVYEHIDGFRGYIINGDTATLNFDFNGITVGESLAVTDIDAAANTITIRRTIKVDGPIAAAKAIGFETPGSHAVRGVKLVDGAILTDVGAVKSPAELAVKADANFRFNVAEPQTIVIDTTFDATVGTPTTQPDPKFPPKNPKKK